MAIAEVQLARERADNILIEGDIPFVDLPTYVAPRGLTMIDYKLCHICGRRSDKTSELQVVHLFGLISCNNENCMTVRSNSLRKYAKDNDMYISCHEPYRTIILSIPDDVRFFREKINGIQNGSLVHAAGSYMLDSDKVKSICVKVYFTVGSNNRDEGTVYEKMVPLHNIMRHTLSLDVIQDLQRLEGLDEPLTIELAKASIVS
jgi:hypothetical protein